MTKTQAGPIAADRLKGFIERIERLREEKKAIGSDERDVFAEAHGVGYDKKALREVLKRRAMDVHDRDEWDALIDVYEHALGARGEAARIVSSGGTYDEAADKTGLSRASVARAVSSRKNAENETKEIARQEEVERSEGIEPVVIGLEDRSSAIELAPPGDEGSGSPDLNGGPACLPQRESCSTEQSPLKSETGAVASHSDGERVATSNSDSYDPGPIPPCLDRRRGVRAPDAAHPYEPVITGSVTGEGT